MADHKQFNNIRSNKKEFNTHNIVPVYMLYDKFIFCLDFTGGKTPSTVIFML